MAYSMPIGVNIGIEALVECLAVNQHLKKLRISGYSTRKLLNPFQFTMITKNEWFGFLISLLHKYIRLLFHYL